MSKLAAKIKVTIKGGSEVDVFVGHWTYNLVKQYIVDNNIGEDDFLIDFPETEQKKKQQEGYKTPIDERRGHKFWYRFKKLAKEILGEDAKGVTVHSTRHAVGARIIFDGGTVKDVKEALHHKSIVTSERYIVHDDKMKKKTAEKLVFGGENAE